jgi:hypothetical protein
MKHLKHLLLISILGLSLISAGIAYAQSSTNYRIEFDVISGGGGEYSSTNYDFYSVLGQSSVTGISSSTSFVNYAGYLYASTGGLGPALPGDCNADGQTAINEVQAAINEFLGISVARPCNDLNSNGQVTIDEIQRVVNAFLGI